MERIALDGMNGTALVWQVGATGWTGPSTFIDHHPVRWGEPDADRFIYLVLVHAIVAISLFPASLAPLVLMRRKEAHKIAGKVLMLLYPTAFALGTTIGLLRIFRDGWAPARADGFTTPVTLTFVWLGFAGICGTVEGYAVRELPRVGKPLNAAARAFLAINALIIAGAISVFVFFGVPVAVSPQNFPVDWTWASDTFPLAMLAFPPLGIYHAVLNTRFWSACAGGDPPADALHAHHRRNMLVAVAIIWNIVIGHTLDHLGVPENTAEGRVVHISGEQVFPIVLVLGIQGRMARRRQKMIESAPAPAGGALTSPLIVPAEGGVDRMA